MIALAAERRGRTVEAVVSPVGASLRRLAVDGVELVRNTLDERPPLSAGVVLAPWPNRVADARWIHEGAIERLVVTEPGLGHALHGLLADREYAVVARDAQSVVLAAGIDAPPGYPFRLDTSVAYTLTAGGVRVAHRIANRGARPAPVALGAHPYLRLGDRPVGDLVFSTSARRALRLDARNIPTGSFPVEGTAFDLRRGCRVHDMPGHAVYTDLGPHPSPNDPEYPSPAYRHRLGDPVAGDAVVLEAERAFAWLQTYVTDEFPGTPPGELAVAIEPMTAPPDALNSGDGLRWLGPGDTWEARWGIRYEDSPAG